MESQVFRTLWTYSAKHVETNTPTRLTSLTEAVSEVIELHDDRPYLGVFQEDQHVLDCFTNLIDVAKVLKVCILLLSPPATSLTAQRPHLGDLGYNFTFGGSLVPTGVIRSVALLPTRNEKGARQEKKLEPKPKPKPHPHGPGKKSRPMQSPLNNYL